MIDLHRKHIFIAGGSRGIGAAAAKMASKAGAVVSITYVNDSKSAERTVAEIEAKGGRASAYQADVSAAGAIEKAIDSSAKRFGPPNGLVFSAGIFEGQKLEDMSVGFWDRMMAVHVRGAFLAVQAAVKHMRKAKNGGSIVIYTSTSGQRGSEIYSAYATAKGAQILFMRSMARELAPDRIRVNCIAPSWTETDMSADVMNAIGRKEILRQCPLGRVGQPDDIAGATCYLLSDLAAFVTGSTMTVDGGIDMRG